MQDCWSFFSFPLNLFLAILWIVGWVWLWKNKSSSAAVRFLLSPTATISSFILLLAAGLWIGFSSNTSIVHSVPFVLALLYIQTVVYLITLRGWRKPCGPIRWRFLLIHAGVLLAIGAAFWGAPDSSELRVQLAKGETTQIAYEMDASIVGLGYELELNDYKTEYSKSGQPQHYEAIVSIDGGESVAITVNHPYNVRFGEDIYLTSVSDKGCVLQIIHEPWRYFALAGIIMLLAGAFMLFIGGPKR